MTVTESPRFDEVQMPMNVKERAGQADLGSFVCVCTVQARQEESVGACITDTKVRKKGSRQEERVQGDVVLAPQRR